MGSEKRKKSACTLIRKEGSALFYVCYAARQLFGNSEEETPQERTPQQPLHHALGIKCPTSIFGLSIRLMHLSIVQAYYFGGDFTCRELETFSLTTNSCFESIKEIFKY